MDDLVRTRGECLFCGRELTLQSMSRHLMACPSRRRAIERVDASDGEHEELYHLQVQNLYGGDYWLHLEMRASATLEDLDDYLRAIWLECCGHMSQFSEGEWGTPEIPMSTRARDVFEPGLEILHVYDFGESSWTSIQVVRVREGRSLTGRPILLMARNDPPVYPCSVCGEPASWLCLECLIEHDEWMTLCDEHAAEHPHENYGPPRLLVNSPRVGMCGYEGPAEPPYRP